MPQYFWQQTFLQLKKLLYMGHKVLYSQHSHIKYWQYLLNIEPDVGGIPSQFPVQEDTQFCQILREALDFFGVDENKHREYFLVDYKTRK